jgi:hypothetical protein
MYYYVQISRKLCLSNDLSYIVHNRKMDGLIAQKLGHCEHSVMKPAMDKLETCMDAYAGEMGKYDFQNKDIILCINILRKNLEKIEFQLDG